jgi:hypothetical protein
MSRKIIRRMLREYAMNDKSEQRILPMDQEMKKVARNLRIRLVSENPNASDEEIDARVRRIMDGGSAPTKAATPPPASKAVTPLPASVKAVWDERRRVRRAEKRKRAHQRRA